MGPQRPKRAQRGPNQPKMGPNAPKMTPNLGARFPYVRQPYNHVFGAPNPGWCRLAATLRRKMAKNGPLEAEMGPKGAKTAKNAPKCPQNDPKPRHKVPLRKATPYHHVFGPPTPSWRWLAATKLLKMAKNGPKQSQRGPNAPKMTPNLGQRSACARPPYHHV